MNIKSIEPTPSPNSMKIILDQKLQEGKRYNFTKENMNQAPEQIREMLKVEGITSIFQVTDFLAVERNPRYEWQPILQQVRGIFGEKAEKPKEEMVEKTNVAFGEIKVLVQFFKGIPIQVKLLDGQEERRFGMPDKLKKAAVDAATTENIVMERKWVEQGIRYGTFEEIGEQVVEELLAAYPDDRLESIFNQAKNSTVEAIERQLKTKVKMEITPEMLDVPDWKKRYALLEQLDPEEKDIPLLKKALKDEKASIRRLAVVYFGMIESEKVLPYLEDAVVNDSSVTVRRTAGDCLSDIGNPKAIPTMIHALKDKNKLVRWRAAMFLYEVGDETAIEALREAENDPEFEVAMQVKIALERIEGGRAAEGSVWRQMTESRNKEDN
ncbi:conserved virulence factor C family protein [Schinkia azotoformans]|uniref:conserved virulence factor C family protein n=1 Tax=Schinkia azotoformans TaxID=1454 RepID=UPI002DB98445|nr:conserved virulence factor C family protein [Schinkia azotoformans]MEC1717013.1 conserved virulence factor C family protein [Schinkia azotoformans]MEC1741317.1 conserved virulence factor C family protein [Schinkia azotoformans]MEC1747492.1 conserved virulence factor C family protein [Schinkia azotoformans]MEC1758068.1 conserved virulence factor C family protein [Schinkia azotoformans]MEC1769167.1 conserved virulence factor C family protein [Schinkia azotoformans]